MRQIHNYMESTYQKAMDKLEKSKLSKTNKELVLKFRDKYLEQRAEDKDRLYIGQILNQIVPCLEAINKEAKEITTEDLARLNNWLRSKKNKTPLLNKKEKGKLLKESTIKAYKFTFKRFMKWLGKSEIYKDDNLIVRKTSRRKKQYNFNDIITDEDCENLTKFCGNVMEIALKDTIHETGSRVGELAGMKIKDVWKSENIANIRVCGKTGERIIPIIKSINPLFAWLSVHPHKDNKEAYVWISQSDKNRNEPLKYGGIVMMLRRIHKKAGLTKKCNPHWYRHSRASLNGQWMTENQLNCFMGWTTGSGMAGVYCHLNGAKLDDTLKQHYGLAKEEDNSKKPKICSVCDNINGFESEFCAKCGTALSLKTAVTSEQIFNKELRETVKKFSELMNDQEKLDKFKAFCRDKELEELRSNSLS